ncbi:FAD-dependent oxidoreductase [Priestia megaterium]|nr:FAD-dependent oxidoreductase [Priestia megaterium]
MKRLVILGGGYGGYQILQTMLQKGLPQDIHITVIDRNPYHSLKTEFYAVASGTVSDKQVRMNFPTHEQIHYLFHEIISIDVHKKQVELRPYGHVEYDYLVIGLGCEDNYHNITGAEEFTQSVQTMKKARKASYALNNLDAGKNVVIVGAGLSGIEVAAELRESRSDLNIRLLDRGDSVLRGFDAKIQQYVEKWFFEHDIEVLHRSNIEYVEKNAVCNNGMCMLADEIVWTAGVQPNVLVRNLPFEKDRFGKVVINEYYQVPSAQDVFVIGDCASSPLPPSAQLAQQQAKQLVSILLCMLKNKQLAKPKEIKSKGVLGSLGHHDGFGDMFNLPFTGLVPRIAKSGVLWIHKRHD